jgi:hypothetical protein
MQELRITSDIARPFNAALWADSNKDLVNVSLLIDSGACPASNQLTVAIRRAG